MFVGADILQPCTVMVSIFSNFHLHDLRNYSMPEFFSEFGSLGAKYECWVSHLDPDIAITELDLRRLKREVTIINYAQFKKLIFKIYKTQPPPLAGDVLPGAPRHLHPVHAVRVLPPGRLLHLQPLPLLPHPS